MANFDSYFEPAYEGDEREILVDEKCREGEIMIHVGTDDEEGVECDWAGTVEAHAWVTHGVAQATWECPQCGEEYAYEYEPDEYRIAKR